MIINLMPRLLAAGGLAFSFLVLPACGDAGMAEPAHWPVEQDDGLAARDSRGVVGKPMNQSEPQTVPYTGKAN